MSIYHQIKVFVINVQEFAINSWQESVIAKIQKINHSFQINSKNGMVVTYFDVISENVHAHVDTFKFSGLDRMSAPVHTNKSSTVFHIMIRNDNL